MNINSWLEDELYQQYLHDQSAVDESWKNVFQRHPAEGNGASVPEFSDLNAALITSGSYHPEVSIPHELGCLESGTAKKNALACCLITSEWCVRFCVWALFVMLACLARDASAYQ